MTTRWLRFCLIAVICLVAVSSLAFAQPGIKELPVVSKPKPRPNTEGVTIRTVARQPTKGTLAVVLNYKVGATVIVKDIQGRTRAKSDADNEGQAEFQLRRGKIYQVEVSHPGYLGSKGKTKTLSATEILRLDLTPEVATYRFRDLPQNSQVFIDNNLRATADKTGAVVITDLKPGKHDLLIRHPEYNDYIDELIIDLDVGNDYTSPKIKFYRVARIAIQGPANAIVLIDGDLRGRINSDGAVRIEYELTKPGEHVISVEQPGYQTWTTRELLSPGVRTFTVKLDPILTSVGFSDLFENLSLWSHPSTWRIVSDPKNKKLEVRGEELGLLADKKYRDFQVNFLVWLDNGKGATWAVRADEAGRNYYLFHLAGPKSTRYTPRRFYTFLISDGRPPVEVSTPTPVIMELNNKSSYTINIIVQGNTIKHTITSNESGVTDELGSWTDTSTEKDKFLYGTFGFRSLDGEVFTVDDLTLELPKQE